MVAVAVPDDETRLRLQLVAWLGPGWSYLEGTEAATAAEHNQWRWMDERAELGLTTFEPVSVRMKAVMQSFGKPRNVRLSLAGSEIGVLTIAPGKSQYDVPRFAINRGVNRVEFTALDGAELPATGDPRRLSVALFYVEVSTDD